jgi:predicted ABC-type ATPase
MKQVIILSGVSGSGKSTYAEKLLTETQGVKVSADHYFTQSDGNYHFDPAKLTEAHADCFRRFIGYLQDPMPWSCVVVDNTNTTVAEIAPYMLGALAFGYQPEIITLRVNTRAPNYQALDMVYRRNTHGVSENVVYSQHNRLSNRVLLPWWKNTDIMVEL